MKSMEPHRNIIKKIGLTVRGVPVDVSRPVNIAYKHINAYIYNAEIYYVTYVYRT